MTISILKEEFKTVTREQLMDWVTILAKAYPELKIVIDVNPKDKYGK